MVSSQERNKDVGDEVRRLRLGVMVLGVGMDVRVDE